MPAAADALAVGVEQHQLDAAEVVPAQQLRDAELQPLQQVAGGELTHVAPGVGVAELQAEPPMQAEVVAEVRAAQRLLQHPLAAVQRLRRLEQGRELDRTLHAEAAGEPERGEQGVAGLGLGDQDLLAAPFGQAQVLYLVLQVEVDVGFCDCIHFLISFYEIDCCWLFLFVNVIVMIIICKMDLITQLTKLSRMQIIQKTNRKFSLNLSEI